MQIVLPSSPGFSTCGHLFFFGGGVQRILVLKKLYWFLICFMSKFETALFPLAFKNQPEGWESHLSSHSLSTTLLYPEKN